MARRIGVNRDSVNEATEVAPANDAVTATLHHPDKSQQSKGASEVRLKVPNSPFECDLEGRLYISEKMLKNLLTN